MWNYKQHQRDHLKYILQKVHTKSQLLYLCGLGQSWLTVNLCSHQWHLCATLEGWSSSLAWLLFPRSADNPSLAKGFIWTWEHILHRQMVTAFTFLTGKSPLGCLVLALGVPAPACQSSRAEGWRNTQTFKRFCANLQESSEEGCYETSARWESSSPGPPVNASLCGTVVNQIHNLIACPKRGCWNLSLILDTAVWPRHNFIKATRAAERQAQHDCEE